MISALSGSVTHVRAEEYSDIRTYGAPDVVRDWMLFGKTPEEARASVMIDALGGGFRQSIFMVADEMGFDVEPTAADHARDGSGHRAHRLTHRPHSAGDGGGATVHLGGHRRRDAGGDRDGQLADGRGAPRSRRGASGPKGSASRSRSRAIRAASPPSRSCIPRRWRRASSAIPASSPRPCTVSMPSRTSAGPRPGLLTYLEMPLVAGRAAPGLHRDRRATLVPGPA